ncbi:hypothetical protein F8M41_004753 [Gigaspora margarita]|uniref:Uncharacterized protein n=1 Tax=Gigaspora margarita TaxID=4874 RepID=A0A8H4A6F4_GIGMA|nr:hypothetical protein F8M41_004753 [Gigaspora margarita]
MARRVPEQSQGFKRLYNNLLADKPSRTLEKNTESQVSRDNTNQTKSFGQSSKNTKNITLGHPLERLRIPPQMRKNKPANGAQRVTKVHDPNPNHPKDTCINDLTGTTVGRQSSLPFTFGTQCVTKVHDPKDTKSTTNNCNTTIVMTIKDLEKEIEQYNNNQCINKQTEKLDQHHTDVKNAHRIAMPQINKINPTKKYPVHKEQKDIREQPTEQPKENWKADTSK